MTDAEVRKLLSKLKKENARQTRVLKKMKRKLLLRTKGVDRPDNYLQGLKREVLNQKDLRKDKDLLRLIDLTELLKELNDVPSARRRQPESSVDRLQRRLDALERVVGKFVVGGGHRRDSTKRRRRR